jgi:hypothetical protein
MTAAFFFLWIKADMGLDGEKMVECFLSFRSTEDSGRVGQYISRVDLCHNIPPCCHPSSYAQNVYQDQNMMCRCSSALYNCTS